MSTLNPKIDLYLSEGCMRCDLGGTPQCKVHNWTEELKLLRMVVLDSSVTEELKWGAPCYTHNGKNILMIAALKDYAVLSFFKGSLLKDTAKILEKPGENTQSARVIKFTDVKKIHDLEPTIKQYIAEAIDNETKGLKADFSAKDELEYPKELVDAFKKDSEYKNAFEALTPGKKRGYVIHFSQPKNSQTVINRIEKFRDKVLIGKGWSEY